MSLNFQTGVFRVNCIDCLDRTNVVQSMLARVVLETQLVKLGVIASGQGIQMHPDFLSIYRNGKKILRESFYFHSNKNFEPLEMPIFLRFLMLVYNNTSNLLNI